MKVYPTADIRNVALIGHGDSGKTSLTSWMLFASGNVKRLGSVDDGTAPTDFDEEEIERKISIQTTLAATEWKNKKINLLDTPGYAAFVADAQGALAVSDSALLLVDGVAGVEVITRRTFRFAEGYDLPLFIVVNKLDRENSDFERTLESIQESFGRAAVALQIPLGHESGFSGVIDLLTMKAHTYDPDGSGKAKIGDVPDDVKEAAEASRAALVEMVAENDDTLMETFFESGDLTPEQLTEGLKKAVLQRTIFPVLCTSAAHGIGIQSVLDTLVALAPAPGDRGPVKGTDAEGKEEVTREIDSKEPLSMFVFKTLADPYAGKLSLFRVCSGTVKGDSHVSNMRTGHPERMSGIALPQGKQLSTIASIQAGDLGVVPKLKDTQTADTLADPGSPIKLPPIEFPEPSISFAVEPKSKGDEDKIANALQRLTEEDKVLKVGRDPQTGELLVSGTGQMHVEVAISIMKRKFGVDAILHPPKVPYLETITRKVESVEGKHKKQSGGRGQFGVCVIHIEPLPRGGGFEFVDKIFGGSIPQNYRPAVEKGIKETAERGWQAGCPVVDFRVTLVDGKYHNVDSSEMAFKIAGSLAFKEAMAKAGPTVLEPIMAVEITSPEEFMGDIMGDLSSRRGKPQGMESQGHYQLIRAQVPMAEMLSYASTLKSLTSDRATYHMEFDHYNPVPAVVKQQIIAENAKAKAEEH